MIKTIRDEVWAFDCEWVPDLQAGRLCAALSEYIPVERHVYALYLPTRHLPAKVRTFINFLLEHIGPEPYWDEE